MRWDVDKALSALEDCVAPGTSITRTVVGIDVLSESGLNPTKAESERGSAVVWCFAIGRGGLPKLFVMTRTVRSGYLSVRRQIKAMTADQRLQLGVKVPKRSAGYEEARKLKKRPRSKTSPV